MRNRIVNYREQNIRYEMCTRTIYRGSEMGDVIVQFFLFKNICAVMRELQLYVNDILNYIDTGWRSW